MSEYSTSTQTCSKWLSFSAIKLYSDGNIPKHPFSRCSFHAPSLFLKEAVTFPFFNVITFSSLKGRVFFSFKNYWPACRMPTISLLIVTVKCPSGLLSALLSRGPPWNNPTAAPPRPAIKTPHWLAVGFRMSVKLLHWHSRSLPSILSSSLAVVLTVPWVWSFFRVCTFADAGRLCLKYSSSPFHLRRVHTSLHGPLWVSAFPSTFSWLLQPEPIFPTIATSLPVRSEVVQCWAIEIRQRNKSVSPSRQWAAWVVLLAFGPQHFIRGLGPGGNPINVR